MEHCYRILELLLGSPNTQNLQSFLISIFFMSIVCGIVWCLGARLVGIVKEAFERLSAGLDSQIKVDRQQTKVLKTLCGKVDQIQDGLCDVKVELVGIRSNVNELDERVKSVENRISE